MEKYKGVYVPDINTAKLDMVFWGKDECLGGKGVAARSLCSTIPCADCVLAFAHRNTAMEYLVENGYMTEGKALELALDNKI